MRGGAGTALVGDPETVAQRMKEYLALGIDTFIMSGYPHLEEAYRVAELVLPPAHQRQRAAAKANGGPFGEKTIEPQRVADVVLGDGLLPKRITTDVPIRKAGS